jgi:CheY-like chemotaxis protein
MYVLHVEDDEAIVRVVSRNLGVAGIRTESAATWRAAFERITSAVPGTFSAAIVDLQLPGGDGLTLFPALRERGIPIVVASAFVDPERPPTSDRDVIWLEKPFNAAVLAAVLRDATAASRAAGTAEEFGAKFGLSRRELQIIVLAEQHIRGQAAAAEMGCTVATYRSYWNRACRKLELKGCSEVIRAYRAYVKQAAP